MVVGQNSSPDWLVQWLQLPYYDARCTQHDKYTTIICANCMGQPQCDICWINNSEEHKDHRPILQVFRASQRAAIEFEEIEKFWDVTLIQKYKINKKAILHLNPSPNNLNEANVSPKCETCNRKLIDSKYCFCSIACKYERIRENRMIEVQIHENDNSNSTPKRTRVRSRKDIPRRAPHK